MNLEESMATITRLPNETTPADLHAVTYSADVTDTVFECDPGLLDDMIAALWIGVVLNRRIQAATDAMDPPLPLHVIDARTGAIVTAGWRCDPQPIMNLEFDPDAPAMSGETIPGYGVTAIRDLGSNVEIDMQTDGQDPQTIVAPVSIFHPSFFGLRTAFLPS